jgi:hypothetical protein
MENTKRAFFGWKTREREAARRWWGENEDTKVGSDDLLLLLPLKTQIHSHVVAMLIAGIQIRNMSANKKNDLKFKYRFRARGEKKNAQTSCPSMAKKWRIDLTRITFWWNLLFR